MTEEKPPLGAFMFVITHQWLMNHQSRRNSWTADQLLSIGIQWPPPRGWMHRVIGKTITEDARARFEMAMRSRQARTSTTLDLFS
jgi:hypothetical protein